MRDCFGPDSAVIIRAGRIGTLQLDLPLDSLHRLCPQIRDTTSKGDEELDTAIVISRPGLSLVGPLASILDTDGAHSVRVDSSTRVKSWTVVGSSGVLPKGVPLTATWGILVHAYGPTGHVDFLNGDVYISFCETPGITFSMAVPWKIQQKYSQIAPATFDSGASASTISMLFVAAAPTEPAPHCQ